MTGKEMHYIKQWMICPGQYVQTHKENSNDMNERTLAAIAMYPSENEQGGHYFISLNTGRIININEWNELPITG